MSNTEKVVGFRKLGISLGTITALIWKPPTDFKVTVVIGIIAVVGIAAQTWLDTREKC